MTGWLTVPKAAAVVGVSRATLWRWLAAGRIPATALLQTGARHYRIAAAWAKAQAANPTNPARIIA